MTVRLTKNELRIQQTRLAQLARYLPTLQLKKAMLQIEVNTAAGEVARLREQMGVVHSRIEPFSALLSEKVTCDVLLYADVLHVKKRYENVAGVEIPILDKIVFRPSEYSLFDTPAWTDRATELLRELVTVRETMHIGQEKKRALEKELRDVSIRVNLFEKVLIPRAEENIKKIRIFLGDQQLGAVAQAKVAKKKIALREETR